MSESYEHQWIRKSLDQLENLPYNGRLSTKLFASNVITLSQFGKIRAAGIDSEKNLELWIILIQRCEASPGCFNEIMECLKSSESTDAFNILNKCRLSQEFVKASKNVSGKEQESTSKQSTIKNLQTRMKSLPELTISKKTNDFESVTAFLKNKKMQEAVELSRLINNENRSPISIYNLAVVLKHNSNLRESKELFKKLYEDMQKGIYDESFQGSGPYLKEDNECIYYNGYFNDVGIIENSNRDLPVEVVAGQLFLMYSIEQMSEKAKNIVQEACKIILPVSIREEFNALYLLSTQNYLVKCNETSKYISITIQNNSKDDEIRNKIHLLSCKGEEKSILKTTKREEELVLEKSQCDADTLSAKIIRKAVTKLTLKDMDVDLSNSLTIIEVNFHRVKVLDWKVANWTIDRLCLHEMDFIEPSNMKIQELTLQRSTLDVQALTASIKKLIIIESTVRPVISCSPLSFVLGCPLIEFALIDVRFEDISGNFLPALDLSYAFRSNPFMLKYLHLDCYDYTNIQSTKLIVSIDCLVSIQFIYLRQCDILYKSYNSYHLKPEELTLRNVHFVDETMNHKKPGVINNFFGFDQMKKLILERMTIDLNKTVTINEVKLVSASVVDWSESNWCITKLIIENTPVKENQLKVKELVLIESGFIDIMSVMSMNLLFLTIRDTILSSSQDEVDNKQLTLQELTVNNMEWIGTFDSSPLINSISNLRKFEWHNQSKHPNFEFALDKLQYIQVLDLRYCTINKSSDIRITPKKLTLVNVKIVEQTVGGKTTELVNTIVNFEQMEDLCLAGMTLDMGEAFSVKEVKLYGTSTQNYSSWKINKFIRKPFKSFFRQANIFISDKSTTHHMGSKQTLTDDLSSNTNIGKDRTYFQGTMEDSKFCSEEIKENVSANNVNWLTNEVFHTIIAHVFLPRKLPQEKVPDNADVNILMATCATVEAFSKYLPSSTVTLFETWASLQCRQGLDALQVMESISSLEHGQMLALHLPAQNCGMILSKILDDKNYVILSTFPASLNNNLVVTSPTDIRVTYPEQSIKIPVSDLLKSKTLSEQLVFLSSTVLDMAMPKSKKSGHQVPEVMDVADTKFISEWLVAALADENSTACPDSEFPKIVKKVRDEVILCKNANLPLRRSGFWMTIKVTLQLNLIFELGYVQGRFMYKLLKLSLMTQICSFWKSSESIDIDLAMQMLAKVARRLEKLRLDSKHEEVILSSELTQLHTNIHKNAQKVIESVRSVMDLNFKSIYDAHMKEGLLQPIENLKFTQDIIYKIPKVTRYIKQRTEKNDEYRNTNNLPSPKYWPRYRSDILDFPPTTLLTSLNVNDEIGAGFILKDVENWILTHLDEFKANTELIREFSFQYAKKAMANYKNDPVGASQMILVILKMIQKVDNIACENYPLLAEHRTGININIIQELLLPSAIDLERAAEIEAYFSERKKAATFPSLVEEDTISDLSFSVRFAASNENMQEVRNSILSVAEAKIAAKLQEFEDAQTKVHKWRMEYNGLSCEYTTDYDRYGNSHKSHKYYCTKCDLKSRIDDCRVSVYERPLRNEIRSQNAVVFELLIPNEIACLRDLIHMLAFDICTTVKVPEVSVSGWWTKHPDLRSYFVDRQRRVYLGSTAKLFADSHYNSIHPESTGIIVDCGYNCTFFGENKLQLSRIIEGDSVKHWTTLKVESGTPYEKLQWALEATSHSQNQILAKQSECSPNVSLAEFVEFGTLRAGNRLQMRNIYRAMETNKLSFKSESVVSLILQTLWETGPTDTQTMRRESHESFIADSIFTEKMIYSLESFLKLQENNWNDHRNLLVIILTTCRIIELTTDLAVSNKAVDLLLYCRIVTMKWMTDVENVLSKSKDASDIDELRNNLIDVALYCSLTFFIDKNSMSYIRIFEPVLIEVKNDDSDENFDDHPPKSIPGEVAWLLSVVKRDNNMVLNSTAVSDMPVVRRNLLRIVNRIGITIEQKISATIQENCSNLDGFTREQWAGAAGGSFSIWKPHPEPADQVLYSELIGKDSVSHWIQIDLILGRFLVDGHPISRLPESITDHGEFNRVFGGTIFEVQPTGNNTFCTTAKYSDCSYFFSTIDNNLIVTEQYKDGNSSELIPHCHLSLEIPLLLIEHYSHWWKPEENIIHFRPKNFSNITFALSEGIEYTLDLNTKLLKENKTGRYLADITSISYEKIMVWLNRLEDKKYCHILTSEAENGEISEIEIDLPRTGLHFNLVNNQLISREYIGKQISCQQTFGTFFGLRNGLLLEDCNSHADKEKVFIVPHGKIETEAQENHQIVRISVEKLREPPVFTYEVDERLRQIKAGKSYAAWYYLAHIHGVTSCPIPDPFTGMTGTENAFRILQSGWCWSSEPFDQEVLHTMHELKQLSPNRTYYPKHVKSMETITWPSSISTSATHEMYALVINHLINDSQRLHFLFPKKESTVGLNEKRVPITDDESAFLAERAYWRNLCYNPNSKIVPIFEEKILKNGFQISTPTNKVVAEDTIRNIKIISSLAHNWSFIVPESNLNLLNQLLISGFDELQGVSVNYIEFNTFQLKEWLDIDFRNQWLDLYNFARNVHEKELHSQWRLMLSLLAFLGKNTNDLLILHIIATNPTAFQNIEPPRYTSYSNPSQQTFNRSTIRSVFSSSRKTEEYFLSSKDYGSWRNYYDDDDRRRIAQYVAEYNSEVEKQIENLTDAVQNMWPCNTVDNSIHHVTAPLNNVSNALGEINANLKSWYENRELGIFIQAVAEKLNSLKADQNGHFQLEPKPWVTSLPTILPQKRFEINYEDKMSINFQTKPEILNSADICKPASNSSPQDVLDYQKQLYQSLWKQLELLIVPPGQQYLVHSGLYPRIVPILMLPKILQPTNGLSVLINFIEKIGIQLSLEMRASRIVKLSRGGRQTEVALQREIEAIPHENWNPAETPEWLLFELEMNMTIRRIQVEVAKQMINPPGGNHSVMQLNMGEGKTAVIVPILASILSNGSQLCRVTVLKSLFRTNFGSLRQCLGGMLNRRIYSFPCRRDMIINESSVVNILESYKECEKLRGIVMTLPEYRLSFQLKTYESGKKKEFPICKALMDINQWLNSHARDILDESDEILHAKYQLIYTVGEQVPPGGGNLRWTIIQSLLKLIPRELKKLWKKYGDSKIEFDENFDMENGPQIFSPCRLLSDDIYPELMDELTKQFLDGNSSIPFLSLPIQKRKIMESFLTNTAVSPDDHREALIIFGDNIPLIDTILILAGYLKYEVLRLAMTKRWRVNYGVNPTGQRKMAVPFKAKDVAAEMTEFGHPDVAICLTHLSYYYSGLTDDQIMECFKILDTIPNPDDHYIKWISKIPKNEVHESIKEFSGINLKNATQRNNLLFPVLRKNMYVIDFWLSHMVFPREAKQFAGKMMCTAWDLVSEEQKLTVSGFSGTNDSKLLLPSTINQNDLKELEDTNENVRKTLELEENDSYESLPPNVNGRFILEKLAQKEIPVLLDAGALMLEFNNKQVATEWLKIVKGISPTSKIAAAVYFDTKNVLMVTDEKNRHREFELSPFRESLDRCLIYLDDAHTRGTDLKFPRGTKACVTLAGGITRDKTVQACMRMRLLGKGHTICFWGSQEADSGIREFCNIDNMQKVNTKNVVSWICNKSRIWSAAGVNYAQKRAAHLLMENKLDSASLEELSDRCTDKELIELMDLYGELKSEVRLITILITRFQQLIYKYQQIPVNASMLDELANVRDGILYRVISEIPKKKRFAQLLDEEQEKELEHELEEERQKSRPGAATPTIATADPAIRKLLETGSLEILASLLTTRKIFSLPFTLDETTLWPITQEDGWGNHIYATKDFSTVIQIPFQSFKVDEFLRPVNWIAKVDKKDGHPQYPFLLLMSPYEANAFLSVFKSNLNSTLHMYAARMHPDHDNLLNTSEIQYPSKNNFTTDFVSEKLEAELAAFSGSIYFKSEKEQDQYCHFLGLIPQPRSMQLQLEFEEGYISAAGFVAPEHRCRISKEIAENCKFTQNPNKLIQGIVERRNEFFPTSSHAALIVLESKKGLIRTSDCEWKQ